MKTRPFGLRFLGIGAEKAGTTWIADCLREHPEVCLPETKEIFFFNDVDPHFLAIRNYRYERGLSWYKRQFNGCKDKIAGEISPTYLYSKTAAIRIKKDFPDIKLIVVLRNPVKRAFSQYIHDKRLGVIKDISFGEAVRMYTNYVEKGLYYKHIKTYLALFNKTRILILFAEDLKKEPKISLNKIYEFLNLKDAKFAPKRLYKKSNVAGKAKFPVINYFMMQTDYFLRTNKLGSVLKILDSFGIREFAKKIRDINSEKLKKYPKIEKGTEKYLKEAFIEDIEKLEKLLNKRLSEWK